MYSNAWSLGACNNYNEPTKTRWIYWGNQVSQTNKRAIDHAAMKGEKC